MLYCDLIDYIVFIINLFNRLIDYLVLLFMNIYYRKNNNNK